MASQEDERSRSTAALRNVEEIARIEQQQGESLPAGARISLAVTNVAGIPHLPPAISPASSSG